MDPMNMDNQREKDRDRSRRGDRPSRFSDATRDRSNDRDRPEGKRLFVSNIPYEFRWTELKDLFKEKVGDVAYVELFNDENGKPRGCGVVEFTNSEAMKKALFVMHRYELNGRKLVLKEETGNERHRLNSTRSAGGPRNARDDKDGLIVNIIDEMPVGQALETPLHPKRRRVRQPADQGATGPVVMPRPPSPIASTSSAAPSPLFVKCEGSAVNTPSTSTVRCSRPRPRRILKDDDIVAINCGSEPSSGESEDEEMSVPFLPRTIRSLLDTPVVEVEEPTAESIAEPAVAELEASEPAPSTTDQPWSFFDFKWEAFPTVPIPPKSRRERFLDNKVGPATPCVDPYDIFITIWDRQIMEHMVSETNKYAEQMVHQLMENNNLHPNSRVNRWYDTCVDELYVYFGMIIAMGVVIKTRLDEYWCASEDIFITPGFTAHMSYNRFFLLSKCLHFNDNYDMCAGELEYSEAKLFKIKPLLSHLNMKFETMYNLDQNISLDESLLMWKGWLDINQFVPNKAATMGIKTYEVCESQTGYLWRFEIHAYKKSPPQQLEDILSAFTPATVLRLLHGLENKGHTVWMDNFYNSPSLARRMKSIGFDCVGTLRTNRKFVPQALHSLTKGNMRPGQLTGLTAGDVDVMVWRDNNRVAMISTYHGNGVSSDGHSTKPILILDYNIMMGGVDRKDQMLAMYPMERKRTKVWYKKLFKRLLNISILNSFIIHKKSAASLASPSLTHRSFRFSLVKALLANHIIKIKPPFSSASPLLIPTQNVPVDVTHRISEHPLVEGHQRLRRQCALCKKRVHTFCVGCKKSVCIEPCFLQLHS